MKTLCLSALAALVLLPASAPAEIDFVLQHRVMTADANSFSQPYITDGGSKIYLGFPGTWRALDSAEALELTPDVANSSVRLTRHQGKILTIDEAGGRQLLQQVIAQLPKDAKNVTSSPVEINPFPISNWTDLQATVSYELFGQTFRRSTMYVNMRPGRVVEFTLTALDADYEKLYRPARAVLASFFEPSNDLPPELAKKYEQGRME